MSNQDAEVDNLQVSIAECEGAATLLAKERDQLLQELRLAADGEAASTKLASNMHKEAAARAQQLETIRLQMSQQTEQVESLTKALNEASTAKDMALHHAAEVDAELQSLKRHAAQLSEQLASLMAGRAVGTLSGLDTVVAGERQARAAAAAAARVTMPSAQAAPAEPSVTHRAMPRPWDATTAMRMPVDTTSAGEGGGGGAAADADAPDRHRSTRAPAVPPPAIPISQPERRQPPAGTSRSEERPSERFGAGGWLSDEQELGRYIRSLDSASNARQERMVSQHAHQSNSVTVTSSEVDEGVARRPNPYAMFARLDGSDSEEPKGTSAKTPHQRKRGKAGKVAGSIKPTNAWR